MYLLLNKWRPQNDVTKLDLNDFSVLWPVDVGTAILSVHSPGKIAAGGPQSVVPKSHRIGWFLPWFQNTLYLSQRSFYPFGTLKAREAN